MVKEFLCQVRGCTEATAGDVVWVKSSDGTLAAFGFVVCSYHRDEIRKHPDGFLSKGHHVVRK
jgi:hypothetical protein